MARKNRRSSIINGVTSSSIIIKRHQQQCISRENIGKWPWRGKQMKINKIVAAWRGVKAAPVANQKQRQASSAYDGTKYNDGDWRRENDEDARDGNSQRPRCKRITHARPALRAAVSTTHEHSCHNRARIAPPSRSARNASPPRSSHLRSALTALNVTPAIAHAHLRVRGIPLRIERALRHAASL